MVVYECERCHKKFNHKGNYNAHINRKKPCKVINDESKELIINSIINDSNDNKCIYCNKVFSRLDSLKRHLLKYCENRNSMIIQNDNLNSILCFPEGYLQLKALLVEIIKKRTPFYEISVTIAGLC